MRTRIKICGLTQPSDAVSAVEAGVDALGLVFFDPSPRSISVNKASKIAKLAPCFVDVVGVFVNPSEDYVRNVLNEVNITCLQFHGDEEKEFCEGFGIPYIKAIRVKANVCLNESVNDYNSAVAILLDTYHSEKYGGTGTSFSWERLKEEASINIPIILAGGLTEKNVSNALTLSKAYGVDISTGIESSPGIKDVSKLRDFVRAVVNHDRLFN